MLQDVEHPTTTAVPEMLSEIWGDENQAPWQPLGLDFYGILRPMLDS